MPQKQQITLNKSLDILELFAQAGSPLNVKEISSAIKLPESTLYRYISTLTQRDFIEYDPTTQKYRLGMNLIRLGYIATRQQEIHRAAYPVMEELAREAGETVFLTLRKDMNAIVVEVVESRRSGIKWAMNRGDTLPLHSCSLTRPLMAYLPSAEIESILRKNRLASYTEHTITNPKQIRAELDKVKRQGYSYSDQELTLGARALGAPIRDYSGEVVATLGLAGSVHSLTRKTVSGLVRLLLSATERCSQKMGFKPSGQNGGSIRPEEILSWNREDK
jgi:IclR family transcriptional regulator, KDG regulon repressor